jgi:hypothetical protein
VCMLSPPSVILQIVARDRLKTQLHWLVEGSALWTQVRLDPHPTYYQLWHLGEVMNFDDLFPYLSSGDNAGNAEDYSRSEVKPCLVPGIMVAIQVQQP